MKNESVCVHSALLEPSFRQRDCHPEVRCALFERRVPADDTDSSIIGSTSLMTEALVRDKTAQGSRQAELSDSWQPNAHPMVAGSSAVTANVMRAVEPRQPPS